MLTKNAIFFVNLFITLLILSLLTASDMLLYASFIPIVVLIIGGFIDNPSQIKICRKGVKKAVWVGDIMEITIHIEVSKGIGIVSIIDELPPVFSLEKGSNFRILWKGFGKKTYSFVYKVRCTKRGVYKITPVKWESIHVLGLRGTVIGDYGEEIALTVRPRIYNIRRVRGRYTQSIFAFPIKSKVKIGLSSQDFKEIRNYVSGDPIKIINWKATARQSMKSRFTPLVNEYEREGRQTIWIFMNASNKLEIGTNIENPLEHVITTVITLSYYFLSREYRVGIYIYNHGVNEYIYPDTGRKQFYIIMKKLNALKSGKIVESFAKVVERNKHYILQYDPLCIIVTDLSKEDKDDFMMGIKKLLMYRKSTRKYKPSIAVVNILHHDMVPVEDSIYGNNSKLLVYGDALYTTKSLRSIGITVLNWNPTKENFGILMMRKVRSR